MQPNNPATPDQNKPSTSVLPTLPVTDTKQVFVHPELANNPTWNQPTATKEIKPTNKNVYIVFAFLILSSITIMGVLLFVFVPKSQIVSYANSTKQTVGNSLENADQINQSLDTLYKALSAQEEDTINIEGSENVLGSSDRVYLSYYLSTNASKTIDTVKNLVAKDSKVKGFAVPENDPAREVRKHRDLASEISDRTQTADKDLDELNKLKSMTVPSQASDLKKEVADLTTKTSYYIDQSGKTSDYYIALSDASIELIKISESLLSLTSISESQIDAEISKLATLKAKFANLSSEELPENIEAYNADVVETFDLLVKFFELTKEVLRNPTNAGIAKLQEYEGKITSVANKSITDEISFWQNNKALSSHEELSKSHTEVLESAQKIKNDNYFFFLQWVGVD